MDTTRTYTQDELDAAFAAGYQEGYGDGIQDEIEETA